MGAETSLRLLQPSPKGAGDLRPETQRADVRAAPHQVHTTFLEFTLPTGVRLEDLRAFRVR